MGKDSSQFEDELKRISEEHEKERQKLELTLQGKEVPFECGRGRNSTDTIIYWNSRTRATKARSTASEREKTTKGGREREKSPDRSSRRKAIDDEITGTRGEKRSKGRTETSFDHDRSVVSQDSRIFTPTRAITHRCVSNVVQIQKKLTHPTRPF